MFTFSEEKETLQTLKKYWGWEVLIKKANLKDQGKLTQCQLTLSQKQHKLNMLVELPLVHVQNQFLLKMTKCAVVKLVPLLET
jgi:hypothetical protein